MSTGTLASIPEDARAALGKLRETIRAAAPEATEVISYQVRTFNVAGAHRLARLHCHGSGRQMREQGERLARPQYHVVAQHRIEPALGRVERGGVLQYQRELANDVEPRSLRHAIDGLDDLAVERRVDGLPHP
jgi:hypothetical protein